MKQFFLYDNRGGRIGHYGRKCDRFDRNSMCQHIQ